MGRWLFQVTASHNRDCGQGRQTHVNFATAKTTESSRLAISLHHRFTLGSRTDLKKLYTGSIIIARYWQMPYVKQDVFERKRSSSAVGRTQGHSSQALVRV